MQIILDDFFRLADLLYINIESFALIHHPYCALVVVSRFLSSDAVIY